MFVVLKTSAVNSFAQAVNVIVHLIAANDVTGACMRLIGILPLLWSCAGEHVLEKQANFAPTVLIVSHSDGAEILAGYQESFRATVSDDDNEFDEISVAWYVGEELVCDFQTASAAGEVFCDIVFTEGDSNVIAEVRDEQSAGGRHEIAVSVLPTEAPIVELLTPDASGTYYTDKLIQFSALVSDEEDALEDLVITWNSSIDGYLELDTWANSSGEISDYTRLTEGEHAIELRVEDLSGKISTDEVVILVGAENNLPDCEIIEPADGDALVVGQAVSFRGLATDPDVPSTELSLMWSSDKDGELGAGSINSDGEIIFSYSDLSVNNHVLTLSVEDEVGGVCQDTILLSVGHLPVVSIVEPIDGATFSTGSLITFQGTVSDQEDQPSAISVSWTSTIDNVLQSGMANPQGISQFSVSSLSAGLHSVSFSATDSSGLEANTSVSFRVNTPPVVTSLSLLPDPVYTDDSLSVMASFTDADGDSITESYQWWEDGVLTSFTGTTISSSALDVGETWTVRVTPNDGYVDGMYAEQSIVISNTLPTITAAAISSSDGSDIYNDSILSCTATASDADEAVSVTYSWLVNGVSYSGSSLDLGNTSVVEGGLIECTASVSDSNGGVAYSVATVTVDAEPLLLASVTIAPNSGVTSSSLLTCSASLLSSGTGTISYQWYIGSSLVGFGSQLQLSKQLVVPADTVECVATATNSTHSSSLSGSVVVNNSDPVISNLSISPSLATAQDSVTCSASVSDIDVGTPILTFAFENLDSGASYSPTSQTSTSALLDLSTVVINPSEELQCSVTAADIHGGQDTDAMSIVIGGNAPTIVVNTQGSPYTGETLSCSATATDFSGNDLSSAVQLQWVNLSDNSAILANSSSYTIQALETDVGDQLSCVGTVVDQYGSTAVASDTDNIVLLNSPPYFLSTPILSNTNPEEGDLLTCSMTAADLDDPTLSNLQVSYEWYNVSTGSLLMTGAQYNVNDSQGVSSIDVGQELNCSVLLGDGQGGVTSETSGNAIVQNTAPTISTPTITPNTGININSELTCLAIGADANDGALFPAYVWTKGGVIIGNQAVLQLDGTLVSSGDTVTCTATVNDNNSGVASAFSTVFVDASGPVFDTPAAISPAPAYTGDVLTCTAEASDLEDGSVPISYAWTIDGATVSSTATYAINPNQTDVGDTIICTATAADSDSLENTSVATVSVSNTAPTVSVPTISPNTNITNSSMLSCFATASDPDELVSVTYAWQQNGFEIATGPSVNLANYSVLPNQMISCVATSNDSNSGTTSQTSSVPIDNRAPTVTGAEISPSAPEAGDTVSCSATISDPDGEQPNPSYAWTINGSPAGSMSSINLATNTPVGTSIVCAVSVFDNYGGTGSDSDTVTVQNTLPTVTIPTITPSSAVDINTLLSCSATGFDRNDGSLNPSYVWTNDSNSGAVIGNLETLQLDGSFASAGDMIRCTATATDLNLGTASASASISIQNSGPVFDIPASISPAVAYTGDLLTCTAEASDVDSTDTPSLSYAWTAGGVTVSTTATYTIDANETDVGETISCTVTATDSQTASTTSVATITVSNTDPTVDTVQISSSSGFLYNDEILTCTANIVDIDEMPEVSYLWSAGGITLGTSSTLDLSSAGLFPSETISCTVTATDSQTAFAQASGTGTIGDRPTTSPTVNLSWTSGGPGALETDDLSCTGSGAYDPDGEAVTYSLAWSSDAGGSISGATVPASATALGEIWTCTVTARSGVSGSATATADVEIVLLPNWSNCPTQQTLDQAIYQFTRPRNYAYLGYAVASAGDVDGDGYPDFLFGAPGDESNTGSFTNRRGAVYLAFSSTLGSGPVIDLEAESFVIYGENTADELGYSVASAGDVDGDGLSDILMMSSQYPSAAAGRTGRAYLFLGATLGGFGETDASSADYIFTGLYAQNIMDIASGDIDGDGISDILISYLDDSTGSNAGAIAIFLGINLGASGSIYDVDQADFLITGAAINEEAGFSFDVGNLDGDGLDDLIIGGKRGRQNGVDSGTVHVLLGSTIANNGSMSLANSDYLFYGEHAYEYLGSDTAFVEDIDGDGFDELLMSAPESDRGAWVAGATYLVFSSSLGASISSEISAAANYIFEGEGNYDYSGKYISGAGDVDGDGSGDILIGAIDYGNTGKAYLIRGGNLGMNSVLSLSSADYAFLGVGTFSGATSEMGHGIAAAGDVDGDGFDDILIGEPKYEYDTSHYQGGRVGIFMACD